MALPTDPARRILTDADITRPGPLSDALGGTSAYDVGLPGYDVILAMGQSNMSGRGQPWSATLDPTVPIIDQYGAKTRVIQPATEPLDMVDTATGIGPALQFARWYTSRLTPGRKVLIIPAAQGGTRLSGSTGDTWRVDRPEPSLYAAAITQTLEGIAAAGPGRHRVVAVLWSQGENDSQAGIPAATYQADLDALITATRADLGVPDLPFILAPMVPEFIATGTTGTPPPSGAAIRDVHADTPNRLPFTAYVHATEDMPHDPADVIHWPAPAQRLIGEQLYRQWLRTL